MPPFIMANHTGGNFIQVKVDSIEKQTIETPVSFTQNQIAIQQAFALSAATVSLVLGLLTAGWFYRMRAMFRHRLIMLLILSDFFKALWYFIFPLARYVHESETRDPAFCHATGFLLAVGIEGADYAVLSIAIHAAMGIFSTKASHGESGLVNYRYYVYIGWLIYPSLMAGLAFINPVAPYVTQGTYCYLPVRPFWYRLALAWIPRYLTLLAIVVMSVTIYIYVWRKFKNFFSPMSSEESYGRLSHPTDRSSTHCGSRYLATNDTDGLTSPTILGDSSPPVMSQKTTVSWSTGDQIQPNPESPAWENYTFGAPTPIPDLAAHEQSKADMPTKRQSTRTQSNESQPSMGFSEDATTIIEALRDCEPPRTLMSSFDGKAANKEIRDQQIASKTLRRRHKAIKRNLRYIFVYPLAYFTLWIIPFIHHCRNYNDHYSADPSFGLAAASTTILASQCAVDALIFCFREKPWKHIESRSAGIGQTLLGSMTPSFLSFKATSQRDRGHSSTSNGTFKNRPLFRTRSADAFYMPKLKIRPPSLNHRYDKATRVADNRRARDRLDAETSDASHGAEARRVARKQSDARRLGADRNWWEVEGRRRKDSVLLGHRNSDDSHTGSSLFANLGLSRTKSKEDKDKDKDKEDNSGSRSSSSKGKSGRLTPESRKSIDMTRDEASGDESRRPGRGMSTVAEETL